MDINFVLNRIRRRLRSRVRLREVMRRTYWLEFENESMLNFLAKYNIVTGCQIQAIKTEQNIQQYTEIENEPEFAIHVIETSNN